MKHYSFIVLYLLLVTSNYAQNGLTFLDDHVIMVSFVDYEKKNPDDSCIFQYVDSIGFIRMEQKHIHHIGSYKYEVLLQELQSLLDELCYNRLPQPEILSISLVELKKRFTRGRIIFKYSEQFLSPNWEDCDSIMKRYRSVDTFYLWLKKTYPIIDSGTFVINTAHDTRGIKIIIQTKKKKYYYDMRDIELFQPYLMRTSDNDCLRFITNFTINKHIRNLFKELKVCRKIPWTNELIDKYIISCAEDYRLP